MKKFSLIVWIFVFQSACYHPHPVHQLPNIGKVEPRTLFLALDGVDYFLIAELKKEGYFKDFFNPAPFISTFPSVTGIGFTGIFKPLGVKKVPGYELKFYSLKDNKMEGGKLSEVYKIIFDFKLFFDRYRHKVEEKGLMYAFPGLAGKQDLKKTEELLYENGKNVLLSYVGGTDGSSHLLGRERTKRFLIYLDGYLHEIKQRYHERTGRDLRVVLFSDHGFLHKKAKNIRLGLLKQRLKENGFRIAKSIQSPYDVVTTRFGQLNSGVFFTTQSAQREKVARILAQTKGVDLVFWYNEDPKKIFVLNSKGEEAGFEFKSEQMYRYQIITGDPLNYIPVLEKNNLKVGQWIDEDTWFRMTYDHEYPDAGYRLYDGLTNLIENPGSILISTEKEYEYGSLAALVGTWTHFGHQGTHGGLFKESTWGFMMTDWGTKRVLPIALRYDQLFPFFIPEVTGGL
ncbi:MAG: alkaline phosphatase family protein [Deltaproteobacteria bacterium]|nr:alkaline phosphatase family protein [Deltaproteobacteria bacterium]